MQAHAVELVLNEKICDSLSSNSEIDALSVLDKFFRTRFAQELQNTRERLAGVDVDSFAVRSSRAENPLMVFTRLRFETGRTGGLARATARIDLDRSFLGTPVSPYIWLDLTSDGLVVDGTGRVLFREGLIESKFHLRALTAALDWQAKIQHLPLKPFYERLRTMNQWTSVLNLEGAWGFCNLEGGTPFAGLKTSPIAASDCYVEGDVGKVSIDPTRAWVWPQFKYEKLHMSIKNLALQRLFANSPPMVFGHMDLKPIGHFQGTLDVAPDAITAQGAADGVEIGVWRNHIRARQWLDHVRGTVLMKSKATEFHVSDVKSGGSDWKGTVDLILRSEGLESTFKADLSKVELDSSVVHLFIPGDIEPANIQLAGTVLDTLAEIHGSIDIPQIDGPLFGAEQVHFAVDTDPDEPLQGFAKAEGVSIYAKPVVHALQKILPGNDSVELDGLSGQWRNDGGNISWNNLKFGDKKSKARFVSLGDVDVDGQITGLALRRNSVAGVDRFEIGGLWPQDVQLRELTATKGKERQLKRLSQQILDQ
jgi:hypothetical protein